MPEFEINIFFSNNISSSYGVLTTWQVLCFVPSFRRNNSKHPEVFSAEDVKMNDSKSAFLRSFQSMRILLVHNNYL